MYRFRLRFDGVWEYEIASIPNCPDLPYLLAPPVRMTLERNSRLSACLDEPARNPPESICCQYKEDVFPGSFCAEFKGIDQDYRFGHYDYYSVVMDPEYERLNWFRGRILELPKPNSERKEWACSGNTPWDFILHRARISGLTDLKYVDFENDEWELRVWVGFVHCYLMARPETRVS